MDDQCTQRSLWHTLTHTKAFVIKGESIDWNSDLHAFNCLAHCSNM